MAHTNNHIVIMAGGVGSRFWPMSTPDCPKQFIDILGVGRTLLQLTFDRFKDICPVENVWVVTNKKYASLVSEQLPEIHSWYGRHRYIGNDPDKTGDRLWIYSC